MTPKVEGFFKFKSKTWQSRWKTKEVLLEFHWYLVKTVHPLRGIFQNI